MNKRTTLLNEHIKLDSVRVVDAHGEQYGIMSSNDAYDIAQDKQMDLVLISPEAKPPVCKIIDWGKHQFDMKKRAKETKSKQSVVDTKEIQLRPTIGANDLATKMNNVKKFLDKGKHVRFYMKFRGREASHSEIGMKMLTDILETLGDSIIVEKHPVLNGRNIIMIIAPRTK